MTVAAQPVIDGQGKKVRSRKDPEGFVVRFAQNTVSDDTFLVGVLSGAFHCRMPKDVPPEKRDDFLAAIRARLEGRYGLDRSKIGNLTATYRLQVNGPGLVNTMLREALSQMQT